MFLICRFHYSKYFLVTRNCASFYYSTCRVTKLYFLVIFSRCLTKGLLEQLVLLGIFALDDVPKISRLDTLDFGDLENLEDENKESEETGVGRSRIL